MTMKFIVYHAPSALVTVEVSPKDTIAKIGLKAFLTLGPNVSVQNPDGTTFEATLDTVLLELPGIKEGARIESAQKIDGGR